MFDKNKKQKPKKTEVKNVQAENIQPVYVSANEKKMSNPEIISGMCLISPIITEKSALLKEQNKYVFKVAPKINKIEIAKAIKSIYGVDVSSVNIVNIHRKQRRFGRSQGYKAGYKKAIVALKHGEKIEDL